MAVLVFPAQYDGVLSFLPIQIFLKNYRKCENKHYRYLFQVGDDIWGQKYIDNLKKEKVETQYVEITENSSTGVAQIIVSEPGDNQIVIVAGANNNLCLKDLEKAEDVIKNAAVLLLQLETAEEVAIKASQMCQGVSNFVNLVLVYFILGILDINTKWCTGFVKL